MTQNYFNFSHKELAFKIYLYKTKLKQKRIPFCTIQSDLVELKILKSDAIFLKEKRRGILI